MISRDANALRGRARRRGLLPLTEQISDPTLGLGVGARLDHDHGDSRCSRRSNAGRGMKYSNSQMKLDQLIGYFNSNKINLIPPFQRGRAWKLPARRRLLENIVHGRPIPAIFLYKQASGSQFDYNILDGKQRLESLIMFIGSARSDLKVENVSAYFFEKSEKKDVGFDIVLGGKKKTFKQLSDEAVRQLREYAIPTIEIDLDDDEASLDEIVGLFVDINTQGEKVKRFDIVKAIGRGNSLLKGAFSMIAQEQKRGKDRFYKKKNNAYTRVLGRLEAIESVAGRNQKVDRIWERLVEIILFNRTKSHRQQGQVLKAFIKSEKASGDYAALTTQETREVARCFNFLDRCYKNTDLAKTRLARDIPHFYTMVTTLLSSNLLDADGAPPAYPNVQEKLLAFGKMLDSSAISSDKEIADAMREYKDAAAKQTTHPGRRKARQDNLLKILRRF